VFDGNSHHEKNTSMIIGRLSGFLTEGALI